MKQHFKIFAAYNKWANGRVYDAVGGLSPDDQWRDVGAFFGSVMGTLNHLVAADRIWMRRFTGQGPSPLALNEIQSRDFDELRAMREAEDQRIIAWVDGLSGEDFDGILNYTPLSDPSQVVTQRVWLPLSHVFNHQTHHRGQVHTILTMLGQPSLSLDLVIFQRT